MAMLVMVDEDTVKPTQWGYVNQDKDLETVTIDPNDTVVAKIELYGHHEVYIYTKDIPNLIKALQAACNSINKNL